VVRSQIILLGIGMPEMDGYALARHFEMTADSAGVMLIESPATVARRSPRPQGRL
jgi:CheY-like chemotaxis protein